jgi:DNA-binding transcriptional ArsR family regulator
VPARSLITKELASLFGVLSHGDRVRIIEELREGSKDVASLAEVLGVSSSRVSQHLQLMRAHHLVDVRREGRRVFYSLFQPELAQWLLQGLEFIEAQLVRSDEIRSAVETVRDMWSDNPSS